MHKLINQLSAKLRTTVALSFFCLTTLLAVNAFATDWYVSATNGNDQNNTGRSTSSPYRTIQKAADNAVSGDVVYVRTGTYREQVDLKANGVTFQAYNGETVTINGTEVLTGWNLEAGSTYKTTMDWNVNAYWGTNQFFQDGTMIELARWPKQTSSDIIMPNNAKAEGISISGTTFTLTDAQFNEPAGRWNGAKIWINLGTPFWDGQGWTGTVTSTSGNTITVDFGSRVRQREPWQIGPGTEYFLFDPTPAGVGNNIDNILGEGEWWKNGNTLYVKTRGRTAPATPGTSGPVIEAKKRHFAFWSATTPVKSGYTIKGFNIFACSITTIPDPKAYGGGSPSNFDETVNNVTLDGLNFKYISHQTDMSGQYQTNHTGWTGLVLHGKNSTIKNCKIRYSATAAISIQGENIDLLNNEIQDANYFVSQAGAVNFGKYLRDSEIGYNKIWNTPIMGLNVRNGQNSDPNVRYKMRIHHNTLYDCMRRSEDSGHIDAFGLDFQWARMDHNRVFNTLQDAAQGAQKYGIYLDFGGPGRKGRLTVDHNVIYNIVTPLLASDLTDVHIYNNVLLTNEYQISPDNTNSQYAIGNFAGGGKGEGNKIINNIMSHPYNEDLGGSGDFSQSEIHNNIMNAKIGSAVLNSLFVDPNNPNMAARNYDLKDGSPAIDKGVLLGAPYDVDVQEEPDLGAKEKGSDGRGTDTTPPSQPTIPEVSDRKERSFTLTWQPTADNIGVAYYELSSSQLLTRYSEVPTITIDNLISLTDYTFSLVAVDGRGNRSSVRTFTVTTGRPEADVTIPKTTSVVTIDGLRDANVYNGPVSKIERAIFNPAFATSAPRDENDFSGNWTAAWDNNNLYIHVTVKDDIRKKESPFDNWYHDDHVEIFINGNGLRPKAYTATDFQLYMRPGENSLGRAKEWLGTLPAGVVGATAEGPGAANYTAELKIPFSALGISSPAELQFIGIDVNIGDDDGLVVSESGTQTLSRKLVWKSEAYKSPYDFGLAQLTGTSTPPNPDLGFENDFTNWFRYGTASISTAPANVRSGSKSGYFANGGANYVVTGLTPGATYKVKAWVKAVSGQDIWAVVSGYGGAQTGARMTSTSWTQSGDIVFTMGANNTSATLAAWTGNGSAAYFDDYTIESCSTCRTASAEVESKQSEAFILQLHPNPANREVTVSLAGFEGESAVQVKMSDMTGKLFVGQQVRMRESVKQVTLPVSHLPQGLFFVTVQGSKTGKTAKLVVTR